MDAEYRMLEVGEIVGPEDEWSFAGCKWEPIAEESHGLVVESDDVGHIRRPTARNLPPEVTEESEDVLICGSHRNQASRLLGKSYRTKTNPPNDFPSIGAVEVNNAIDVLSVTLAERDAARAKVEELKRERDEWREAFKAWGDRTPAQVHEALRRRWEGLVVSSDSLRSKLSAAQAALLEIDVVLSIPCACARDLETNVQIARAIIITECAALAIQPNEQEERV